MSNDNLLSEMGKKQFKIIELENKILDLSAIISKFRVMRKFTIFGFVILIGRKE